MIKGVADMYLNEIFYPLISKLEPNIYARFLNFYFFSGPKADSIIEL